MGTSCTASSIYNHQWMCAKAIDGYVLACSQWATYHQGTEAWIELQFSGTVYINYTRIMQRFYQNEQFKDIKITYGKRQTMIQVKQ